MGKFALTCGASYQNKLDKNRKLEPGDKVIVDINSYKIMIVCKNGTPVIKSWPMSSKEFQRLFVEPYKSVPKI